MVTEVFFRWVVATVLLAMIVISSYFRKRARQSGDVILRSREDTTIVLGRILGSLVLFGSIITYIVNPRWMSWSQLMLPSWLRCLAVLVCVAAIISLYYVFLTIGANISETYLTKRNHVLVTSGPYRWIRHPLYSFSIAGFLSMAIVASNWFIGAATLLAFVAVSSFVVPKEEAALIEKFGSEYRNYMERTGRFVPRFRSVQ